MARETLPIALQLTFGHEGAFSSAKTDKGNYHLGVLVGTKYGITGETLARHRKVKTVTIDEVRNMSINEAADIYRIGYWSQSGGDILPRGLDYAAFDFGVNSGPARAVKVLQQLVGVVADGNAGPATLAAVDAYPGGLEKLITDYCAARLRFLQSLTNPKTGFPVNGRGWTIRVTGIDPKGLYAPQKGVVGNALALARQDTAPAFGMIAARTPIPNGGEAKAIPSQPNAFVSPEVISSVGGVMAGIPAILSVQGPIQYVLAAGVAVAILLGAYYAFKRIASTPV